MRCIMNNNEYIKYKKYIGKVVRHFKGNYYYIENIGLNSENLEYMVVYRALYNNNVWIRPLTSFFEKIDLKKEGNITKQKHRFEIVKDVIVDYTK